MQRSLGAWTCGCSVSAWLQFLNVILNKMTCKIAAVLCEFLYSEVKFGCALQQSVNSWHWGRKGGCFLEELKMSLASPVSQYSVPTAQTYMDSEPADSIWPHKRTSTRMVNGLTRRAEAVAGPTYGLKMTPRSGSCVCEGRRGESSASISWHVIFCCPLSDCEVKTIPPVLIGEYLTHFIRF